MKSSKEKRTRLAQILLGAAIVFSLIGLRQTHAGDEPVHLVTDWSHRHLIFSAPHNLGQHVQFLASPRYVQQLIRRNAGQNGSPDSWRWRRAPEPTEQPLQGDWSMDLGPGATVGQNNYPAKYSFDATTAKCGTNPNPDFVVYNTGLAGLATGTAAHQTITFGGTGTSGTPTGTVVITNGATNLTLTATAGTSSGTNFHVVADSSAANRTANAASLVATITTAGNGSSVGVTATNAAGVVTITATTAGSAGNSIALTGTMSGSQGVSAFTGTDLAGGTDPQASVVAFDNLYSGCGGTVPSTYWAYNTGGTVATSPALSGDGKQVAFVENVGTIANLVLLKWQSSTTELFNAPMTLTTQTSAANYRSCSAPCMYLIPFAASGTETDTNSSPFYDFVNDVLWVGDNTGVLQKFTGVFNGTPARVTTGGFPATLTAGNVATSPVFDDGSKLVFVADGTPAGMGDGQLYSVNSTNGTVIKSIELSRGVGFTDGPILDPSNETIYLFTADNTGATCGTTENAVVTMPSNFTATTTETSTNISPAGVCSPTLSIHSGTFDNAYYAGGAGHIYVCSGIGGVPTLYQVPISATGVVGATATAGPALAATGNLCGPVTEVFNTSTSTDWIFTSVYNGAVTTTPISCPAASGCIMSFNVTSGATVTTTTPATTGHVTVAGGASGISVDNTVGSGTLAGASEVYFTPLSASGQTCTTSGGTGGCAIQASQSGLN